jgi:hypothetical protein
LLTGRLVVALREARWARLYSQGNGKEVRVRAKSSDETKTMNRTGIMQSTIKKGAIALAILLGISFSLCAQTEVGALVPPDAIPQHGTFYSTQGFPPMPEDLWPGLDVYSLGNGNFLIDDSSNPGAWQGASLQIGAQGASMDDSGLPSPGDGGDGTNSGGGGVFWSDDFLSTNGLFLQIGGITNGVISLSINNATNFVYEIFSTETLSEELTNWNIEQAVFPTNTSMPFTVAELNRTNNLVFYSRDWTGVISDGNLITPEWWLF